MLTHHQCWFLESPDIFNTLIFWRHDKGTSDHSPCPSGIWLPPLHSTILPEPSGISLSPASMRLPTALLQLVALMQSASLPPPSTGSFILSWKAMTNPNKNRGQDNVSYEIRLGDDVWWNFHLPLQVNCHQQISSTVVQTKKKMCSMFSLAFVLPSKWMAL